MSSQDAATAPPRITRGGLTIVAVVALFGALLIGGGVNLLVQRQTGERTTAKVTSCESRGTYRNRSTHCTGTWVTGGSLLDGGRVRVGTVDGADTDEEGKTVSVTLSESGDTAYMRSLAKPLLLIGLGLFPLLLAGVLLFAMLRKPASGAPEGGHPE